MAENNSVVKSVKLYDIGKNSLWLSIVHDKRYNRYSLEITRKLTNNKNNKAKEGSSTSYLSLTFAKTLVDQLSGANQFAKNSAEYSVLKFIDYFV